jgi:Cu(I)/Ag(I) efflux system membrane fusion protein
MKTIIAIITALIVLSFSVISQEMKSDKHQMDSTKVEKPMSHKQHHDTTMTIQKVQHYTCAMHPEVITNKPGKCPKCGMTLVKMGTKKVKEAIADVYTCTMHPDVKSDKPGKCPICKMNLVKEKKDK